MTTRPADRPNLSTEATVWEVAREFLTRARNEQVKARYDLYLAAAALERILERGSAVPQ